MQTIHQKRLDAFMRAGLYFVTSEPLSKGRSSLEVARAFLEAGGRLLQLREKDFTPVQRAAYASALRQLTDDHGALLIINDDVDLAIACEADGVHLGQEDASCRVVREAHPDLLIGVSTHNTDEAVQAEMDGASYINIGPIYPTSTKQWDDEYLGLEAIPLISGTVSLPFSVMGGIKAGHIPDLCAAGCQTIALVTAISAADDPGQATAELLSLIAANKAE
jgi:thiamine-phosphate pyrophosphorylase